MVHYKEDIELPRYTDKKEVIKMAETKLEYLKEKLEEQGLADDQWEAWLDNASETVFAARQVLEKFEPYATSEISSLTDAEEYLIGLKEELKEVIV